ncbi:MAG: helix-turn-helix domain-containing protein [bacterium]|nr:helix-turn-helix domain-containing protein [bacterium]
MIDVDVIEDPAAATAALDPLRRQLLAELREPASAASLAGRLGMPRQKLNYHLRTLERLGLARVAEERSWGGLTERRLVATARSYVVSPGALGDLAADPDAGSKQADRLSAGHLIALAARVVREVGSLFRRATANGKRLATLSIDTTIRFRSPSERADFSRDLQRCVNELVARYHDDAAPAGRSHRLVVAAHPQPAAAGSEEDCSHADTKG